MFAQLCISNLMVICKLTKITCFENDICGVCHKRKKLSLIGDKVKPQLDNTVYNYFHKHLMHFVKNVKHLLNMYLKNMRVESYK
jgi:hypothetical protein